MLDEATKNRRQEIIKSQIELHSGVSEELMKWIVASLLVINSGALVAISSVESLRKEVFGYAGALFVGGIISILLCALVLAIGYAMTSREFADRLWNNEALDAGSYTEAAETIKSHNAPYGIGFILLICSAGCFIAGCFSLAGISNS